MQGKANTPKHSYLYREIRYSASRGLAINYAAMERQVNAINLYAHEEKMLLQSRTKAFLKVLSHV
ncbi:MAG: hypothetical protein R3208_22710 [Ketobacteraceae bacterium]|nr:hypothetical protein [Ketobacteraceae bacterium]